MSFGAIGGSVASAVAGSVASKAIGSIMGGGSQRKAEKAQRRMAQEQARMGRKMEGIGDATRQWGDETWGKLDENVQDVLGRMTGVMDTTKAIQEGLSDVPDWMRGVGEGMVDTGNEITGMGRDAIARHRDMYQPIEQQWVDRYQSYANPDYLAQREAQASADATQAFDAERDNALRQLESYGIDPSQTRYAGIGRLAGMARASQQALMQTQARNSALTEQDKMRQDILNYGANYQNWGQEQMRTGIGAVEAGGRMGGSAVEAGRGIAAIGGTAAGIGTDIARVSNETARTGIGLKQAGAGYYGQASNMFGGAGSGYAAAGTSGQQADERYDYYGQQIGEAIGGAVNRKINGPSVQMYTPEPQFNGPSNQTYTPKPQFNGPSNQTYTPKQQLGYAEGGEVIGPGGPKDDQVPIMASNHEYVIPSEVVWRKGTEFFDKLVQKVQSETQAIPV